MYHAQIDRYARSGTVLINTDIPNFLEHKDFDLPLLSLQSICYNES